MDRARELAGRDAERYGARAGTYGRNDVFAGRALVGKLGEIAVESWLARSSTVFPLFEHSTFASQADLLLNPSKDPFRNERFNKYLDEVEIARIAEIDAGLTKPKRPRLEKKPWERGDYGPATRPSNLPAPPTLAQFDPPPPAAPAVTVPDDFAIEVKTWRVRSWGEFGLSVNAEQFPRIRQKADGLVWCRVMEHGERWGTVDIMGWNRPGDIEVGASSRWSAGLVGQWQMPANFVRPLAHPRNFADERLLPEYDTEDCGHGVRKRRCFTCALPNPQSVPQVRVSDGDARFFHHPDRDAVVAAHDNWAFTATTWTRPVVDVVEHLPACPWCFPRSLDPALA